MKIHVIDARSLEHPKGMAVQYDRDMTDAEIEARQSESTAAKSVLAQQVAAEDKAKKQAAREAFIDDLMAAEAAK